MKRLLEMTIQVEVEDLDEDVRKEHWNDMCLSEYEDEYLPGVDDHEASEFAHLIAYAIETDNGEMFEGSDVYGMLGTEVKILSMQWIGEPEGEPAQKTYYEEKS